MLAAVGRVAAESSVVEDQLRELFCYLIDSPYGRIIAAGEDLANLCVMCMRVARYNTRLSDAAIEQLAGIVRAVTVLRPHRNFLVHARWEKLTKPGEHYGIRSSRASTKPRAQGIYDAVVWSPADAEAIADQFHLLSEYIAAFVDRTFARPRYVDLLERGTWDRFEKMFGPVRDVRPDGPPPAPPVELLDF